MVGDTISTYNIEAELASDSLGVVYQAHDTVNKRSVSLRILPPTATRFPELRERLDHNLKEARSLDHPNIDRVQDFGETDAGQLYVVTPFTAGETLRQRIARGPMLLAEALAIAIEAAQGLAVAHERQIIHGDLSPERIFLTSHGQVKIMDFGLAKLAPQMHGEDFGLAPGDVAYAAPERVGSRTIDVRADIWSLGAILYEMVTNEAPFKGKRTEDLVHAILNDTPEPADYLRAGVSPALQTVLDTCLAKDPQARYADGGKLVIALQKATSALVGSARLVSQQMPLSHPRTQRRMPAAAVAAGAIFGLLAVMIGFNLGGMRDRFTGRPAPHGPAAAIAILPFANEAQDPAQDYFVTGIYTSLNDVLAQVGDLRVIARNSVIQYSPAALSAAEIAEAAEVLDVDAIVTGSVARAGESVHVRVDVIEGASGRSLWSHGFERDLSEVPALQNEIALAVARIWDAVLSPAEQERFARARPVNPAAQDAYMRGQHLLIQSDSAAVAAARLAFQLAIDIDPDFAAGHLGLAQSYAATAAATMPDPAHRAKMSKTTVTACEEARTEVLEALRLDNGLATAHHLLGAIHMECDWDWPAAEQALRRAIALNPNHAGARTDYGRFLSIMARHEEALAQMEQASGLDPNSVATITQHGYCLYRAGRLTEATARLKQAILWQADFAPAHVGIGLVELLADNTDAAILSFEQADALLDGTASHLTAYAYALGGQEARAREIATQLERHRAAASLISPTDLALLRVALGDTAGAFALLENAVAQHADLATIYSDPRFDDLRGDPRYEVLIKSMGLER